MQTGKSFEVKIDEDIGEDEDVDYIPPKSNNIFNSRPMEQERMREILPRETHYPMENPQILRGNILEKNLGIINVTIASRTETTGEVDEVLIDFANKDSGWPNGKDIRDVQTYTITYENLSDLVLNVNPFSFHPLANKHSVVLFNQIVNGILAENKTTEPKNKTEVTPEEISESYMKYINNQED